ncbi:uncharacterized protein BO97DRAFT_407117 [Aspergillus homomorphus CBS 101889]|uniref:Uncharacterized protein n=1 Tax=Aspergillus homomorphus (strain CBS 101889) TaxID=1450537 RepID=A0A395HS38_ASPHC|nr:hypothetical protein BO97DRAFT_407117 [Aspergillus homomorphus CBS 101889]RAL10233.1 hypothetical protein BO97DRAFT_407117 [Aspergillus homomorphus CBS 101889]
MTSFTAIQRPPSAPLGNLPRTDAQLAGDAWRYLSRQVRKLRRHHTPNGSQRQALPNAETDSVISEMETLVVTEDEKNGKETSG